MPNGVRDMGSNIVTNLSLKNGMTNPEKIAALKEAKETLDSLLGEFRTGELVGRRLRLALEHIKTQIIILEDA